MIDEATFGRGAPTHPLLTVPGLVSTAAGELLGCSAASFTLTEVQSAYLELKGALAQLEAAKLHVVRMLLDHERPSRRTAPGVQTKGWLERAARLGSGAASAEVAAARATDPGRGPLRGLGAALAAGEVSRQHVDVAARLLPRLPERVLEEQRETVDEQLTTQSRDFSPSDSETLVRHLRRALADDAGAVDDDAWPEPEPPRASFERRQSSWSTDWTGMTHFRASLPPELAKTVIAALSGLAAPTRAPSGTADGGGSPDADPNDDGGGGGGGGPGAGPDPGAGPGTSPHAGSDEGTAPDPDAGPDAEPDRRTTTQRRADAFVELTQRALAASGEAELEVSRLVVVATEAQLAGDAGAGSATCTHDPDPLSPDALRRYACDAVVDRVVLDRRGAVVRMESVGRLATRAMRRALAARDGGCAFPGCGAPASWCEAHHIVFWSDGGRTVIANLVLLCSRHHAEVHLGHWVVTVREEVPWFVPPPWVDNEQVPIRNWFHRRIAETGGLARSLRSPVSDSDGPSAA